MARKSGLPKGTLDTLIEETETVEPAAATAAITHDELPVRARARKAKKLVPPYTTRGSKRTAPRAASSRPTIAWETDPVSRYAASRGLPVVAGALPAIRLAMQFAMDVREVARKERTTMLGVVSKALAGYLTSYDHV